MKIRLALIDDKVNPNFLVRNCTILDAQSYENKEYNYKIDFNITHATVIAVIIQTYSEVEIYNLVVQDSLEQKANINILDSAFNWCIKNEINVINLSLGSTYFNDRYRIYELTCRLMKHDIILISASSNSDLITYPASFNNVIGVKYSNNVGPDSHVFIDNPIDGVNIITGCIDACNNLTFERCNSFATAHISAKVCNYLANKERVSYDKVIEFLKSTSDSFEKYHKPLHSIEKINKPIILLDAQYFNENNLLLLIIQEFLKFNINCAVLCNSYSNLKENIFNITNNLFNGKRLDDIVNIIDRYSNGDIYIIAGIDLFREAQKIVDLIIKIDLNYIEYSTIKDKKLTVFYKEIISNITEAHLAKIINKSLIEIFDYK